MPEEKLEIPPLKEGEYEKATITTKAVRDENFQVIYTNFINAGFTAWDIRLNFGLLGISATGEPNVTELAAVILTPQLAKALLSVLNGHLKAYEQDNGEIQLPKSILVEAQARKAHAQPAPEAQPEKGPPAEE